MSFVGDASSSQRKHFYEANSSPPKMEKRSSVRPPISPTSEEFNNQLSMNYQHSQASDPSSVVSHSETSLPLQNIDSAPQNTGPEPSGISKDWWVSLESEHSPGASPKGFSEHVPRQDTPPSTSQANQAASPFSMTIPYAYHSAYTSDQAGSDRVNFSPKEGTQYRQASPTHQSIRSVQSVDLEDCKPENRFSVSPSPMLFNHSFEGAHENYDAPQNEIKREAQTVEPLARHPGSRPNQLAPTPEEAETEQLAHNSTHNMVREDTSEADDSTDRLEDVEDEDEDNSLSILNSLPTPRVPSAKLQPGGHAYRSELGSEGFIFPTSSQQSHLSDTRRPSYPMAGPSSSGSGSNSPASSFLRQPLGPPVGEHMHASHGSQSISESSSKDSFGDSPRLVPQRPRSAILPGRKRQSYYDFGGSGAPSLINLNLADAVANEQGPSGMNALLPRMKTIELYRKNARKSNDPELEFQLAQYMMQTALIASSQRREQGKTARAKSVDMTSIGTSGKSETQDSSESGSSAGRSSNSSSAKSNENQDVDRIIANIFKDAMNSLKRLSEHGNADAQYLLGDIYSSPAVNNAPDMEKSFKYFSMAGKHNHAEAAYRAALCLQEGWGTIRDAGRALQFYRSAAVRNQPGALYQLGMAYFYGGMGLPDNSANRQAGVKWLGRAVNASNTTFNRAPYELGKIFEVGYKDLVIPDGVYSAKLYSRSAELGFIPAAARLGRAYEFGELGCPQDPSLSIHYFTIAALGNDPTAQLSMCAWYVAGAGPSFPVNLDEAYEWCLRAALNGLPKAQYTLAYFLENGTGTQRDILEASRWYRTAAANGYEKAIKRVKELGLAEAEKTKGKCIVM